MGIDTAWRLKIGIANVVVTPDNISYSDVPPRLACVLIANSNQLTCCMTCLTLMLLQNEAEILWPRASQPRRRT